MHPSVDRYIDIGGKVTLFTNRLAVGFLAGMAWRIVLEILRLETVWRLVIPLNILLGFLFQGIWVMLIIQRFRDSLDDSEVRNLVDAACKRMNLTVEPDLLLHDSHRPLLDSNCSIGFLAILLSPPAVQDINENPQYGEVALADELEKLQKTRKYRSFAFSTIAFIFGSSFSAFLHMLYEFFGMHTIFTFMPVLLAVTLAAFVIIAILSLPLSPLEKEVTKKYGMDPTLARMRLFGTIDIGHRPDEEFTTSQLRELAEGAKAGRERLLQSGLAIGIIVGIFSTAAISLCSSPRFPLFAEIAFGVSFGLIALFAVVLVGGLFLLSTSSIGNGGL